MNPLALDLFVCPQCRSTGLETSAVGTPKSRDAASEGALVCKGCDARFPIVGAVPRFVESDRYVESFGYQWNLHRKTQLDSYTGLPLSKNRLFGVSGWKADMKGQVILEAGSGAGRFTEVLLATGAEVFSFDLSSAVDANFANNGLNSRLHLFQADILNLPVRRAAFDGVMCLGVLQHTPNPEQTFHALSAHVKPGGSLVVDCYANNLKSMLHWKYVLRPIAKRLKKGTLYRAIEILVPILLPLAIALRRLGGKAGGRLLPIHQYAHWGLPYDLNKQWAILDTFDMYSPEFDKPQSLAAVRRWFEDAGYQHIEVQYGPNGVPGRGIKPLP